MLPRKSSHSIDANAIQFKKRVRPGINNYVGVIIIIHRPAKSAQADRIIIIIIWISRQHPGILNVWRSSGIDEQYGVRGGVTAPAGWGDFARGIIWIIGARIISRASILLLLLGFFLEVLVLEGVVVNEQDKDVDSHGGRD